MTAERDLERRRVRIVVAEGRATRRGLLRFVLEGEGFDVVAEATSVVRLVEVLAIQQPDAVVLDDGIGASVVVVVREMLPDTKIVLVWPDGVVPIAADAHVDPTEVLRDLGAAVSRACGMPQPVSATGAVSSMARRAAVADTWPVSRREAIAQHPSSGGSDAKVIPGPGVARRRRREAPDGPVIVDHDPAPVLILPVTPPIDTDDEDG